MYAKHRSNIGKYRVWPQAKYPVETLRLLGLTEKWMLRFLDQTPSD